MSEPNQAKRYYVSGRVQGVGYRYFVTGAASRLKINGYVRNLRDGRVEVYAAGTDGQLRAFVAELRRGPQEASVTEVTEVAVELSTRFTVGFSIESEDRL